MALYYKEFDLQHHGDYLEQKEFGFIRSHLYAYEEIWKRFVGHDGKGRMPYLSLPDEIKKMRTDVGELMYTCLESAVCMWFIVEEANKLEIEQYTDYINFLNNLLCFQAHAGRLRDNAEKIVQAVIKSKNKQKEVIITLDDYYKQRNTVLHGRKIPFAVFEKLILIPTPQGKDSSDLNKWSLSLSWDDVSSKSDIQFFSEYLNINFEGIIKHLNQVLFNVLEDIKDIVKENNIVLTPSSESVTEFDPPGSTEVFPYIERLRLGKTLQWPSGSFNYDNE